MKTTGQCVPVPTMGTVCAGTGVGWDLLTCGLPMMNPRFHEKRYESYEYKWFVMGKRRVTRSVHDKKCEILMVHKSCG